MSITMIPPCLAVIWVLTMKSLKTMVRNSNIVLMLAGASVIIFGSLGFMYSSSYHAVNSFMNVKPYQELHFEIICQRPPSSTSLASDSLPATCRPMPSDALTPTDLLFQSASTTSNANRHDVMDLLLSLFLHGVPLIDLHDFITLSDMINTYFGEGEVARMMQSEVIRERFGNVLQVKHKEFRFAPRNCYTEQFVLYLQQRSPITEVGIGQDYSYAL